MGSDKEIFDQVVKYICQCCPGYPPDVGRLTLGTRLADIPGLDKFALITLCAYQFGNTMIFNDWTKTTIGELVENCCPQ